MAYNGSLDTDDLKVEDDLAFLSHSHTTSNLNSTLEWLGLRIHPTKSKVITRCAVKGN